MGPHTGQPGKQILVLGQFHLQAAFPGLGPPRENIQDQAAAVQHLHAQRFRQIAHLRGRKLIVEHRQIAVVGRNQFLYLLGFAAADKAARVWRIPVLQGPAHSFAPRRLQQGRQFFHGHIRAALFRRHTVRRKAHQHGPFFLFLLYFLHQNLRT